MKFTPLTQFVLATGITLALTALLTIPASSVAADQLKGAQLQIGERPAPVPALTVALATADNILACGSCTNATQPFATHESRGALVKTGVVTIHECPSCKTAITTTGAGRAKVEVAEHTCGSGKISNCCGGIAGI